MKEEKVRHQSPDSKFAEDRQLAITHKHAMEALQATPGWIIIAEFLREQVEQLTTEVIDLPLHYSPELTVERQEYVKGQIKAFKLVLGLPARTADLASDALETLPPDEELSDEDGPEDEPDFRI